MHGAIFEHEKSENTKTTESVRETVWCGDLLTDKGRFILAVIIPNGCRKFQASDSLSWKNIFVYVYYCITKL